ncbi:MAG: hypothetical protein ABGY10_03035, partial [bacterium]
MRSEGKPNTLKELSEILDSYEDEVLEFTKELIATDSANPPGDERAVAQLLVDRLRGLGIDDVKAIGPEDERPSVLASVEGDKPGASLILSGHIDT